MELKIYTDYEALSKQVAEKILETVKNKPNAVLCLASGDTPRLAYKLVVEKAKSEKIDFTKVTFVALDEWLGIPPENEGSCHYFLQQNIFKPMQTGSKQIYLFDGLTKDPEKECLKMNKGISDKGGIDLIVVGVGMNGHIGFNEPGVSIDHYAHVVPLDEITQSVGQKYFKEQTSLTLGITLGLKHLLESKKAIMIANGEKKAKVIQQAVEGPISTQMPASIMRKHPKSFVMVDEGAAALLKD